jgi:hypothetical protein
MLLFDGCAAKSYPHSGVRVRSGRRPGPQRGLEITALVIPVAVHGRDATSQVFSNGNRAATSCELDDRVGQRGASPVLPARLVKTCRML